MLCSLVDLLLKIISHVRPINKPVCKIISMEIQRSAGLQSLSKMFCPMVYELKILINTLL